jgi:RNA polymerase sigma-70 factor (ECF subfamily)
MSASYLPSSSARASSRPLPLAEIDDLDRERALERFAKVMGALGALTPDPANTNEAATAEDGDESGADSAPRSGLRLALHPVDPRDREDEVPSTCSPENADALLVHAARSGDPTACERIWRKHVAQVRSRLRRSIGTRDLEDLTQEVFMRLFEFLPQLRDPSALRSFIIGITLRVAGTELRRRRCRWWLRLTPNGELPEDGIWSTLDDEAREALTRFEDVLAKLKPEARQIFELRYVEEKSLIEVAQAMKLSLATAKRHLARASARVFAMVERDAALAPYFDMVVRDG